MAFCPFILSDRKNMGWFIDEGEMSSKRSRGCLDKEWDEFAGDSHQWSKIFWLGNEDVEYQECQSDGWVLRVFYSRNQLTIYKYGITLWENNPTR